MASIKPYKKDGKTFYDVRVYLGIDESTGKPRYAHKRGLHEKEATLFAARMTLAADSGDLLKSENPLFKDVSMQWLAGYRNTVRPTTFGFTRKMFDNHILADLGEKRISKITTATLQRVVNKWAKLSTAAYVRWWGLTRGIFRYAIKLRYLAYDPCVAVIVPKHSKETAGDEPENFWGKEDLAKFFSRIDPIKYPKRFALFRVLAFSGMRKGECLALTWADISFTDNTIRINKTLSLDEDGGLMIQPPKTRAGRRTLPMDAKTMAILRHWRVQQIKVLLAQGINGNRPEQIVFQGKDNHYLHTATPQYWINSIQEVSKRELKRNPDAKSPFSNRITVHGLRHSHASALFAAGATIKEVQTRLGHEDAQTTLNIYTHVTEAQNEEAANKVAAYLNF